MSNNMRKYEALYQSNADHYGTYEKSYGSQKISSISQTEKGLVSIRFKGLEEVSVLISPRGTVQVFYSTLGELDACLMLLNEVLVPRVSEVLYLVPKGTYTIVDKIRCLIQEGKISHDMSLDSEQFAELTGWKKEDVKDVMPTIIQEKFPYGIELKVSRIIAGCSMAEPNVGEWLKSVEQALKREGFYSPESFEWDQKQYFELVKHFCASPDFDVVVRVKAFLDGRAIIEATPRRFVDSAHKIFTNILDKYAIPYKTEAPVKTAGVPLKLVAILGIAFGTLALCLLLRSSKQN